MLPFFLKIFFSNQDNFLSSAFKINDDDDDDEDAKN